MTDREILQRTLRVLDQSTSMHAALRDMYHHRAVVTDLLRLVGSAALLMLAFFDPRLLSRYFDTASFQVGLRLIAFVLFALAIVKLRVKWEERSERHDRAVRELSALVARGREVNAAGEGTEVASFLRTAAQVQGTVPPIPESKFLRLKACHKRKVAISRLLDKRPGAPIWFLRLALLARGLRGVDDAE